VNEGKDHTCIFGKGISPLEKKISEGEKETEMMGDTRRGKKLFCNLLKEKRK